MRAWHNYIGAIIHCVAILVYVYRLERKLSEEMWDAQTLSLVNHYMKEAVKEAKKAALQGEVSTEQPLQQVPSMQHSGDLREATHYFPPSCNYQHSSS